MYTLTEFIKSTETQVYQKTVFNRIIQYTNDTCIMI